MAKKIKLSERIDKLVETPTYVTLKDHKDNFRRSPSCPLINPSKSEIGKLSKIILENISKTCYHNLNTIYEKIPTKSFIGSAISTRSRIAKSYSWT